MSRFDAIHETTEYWVSLELEEGEREKIENHKLFDDLHIDWLRDSEIISDTFESEESANEFLDVLQEILEDE